MPATTYVTASGHGARFLDAFKPGSSELDWCEPNYMVSGSIAEFFNTLSNILFFLIPPLQAYAHRKYAQHVMSCINVIWILFVVVGIGSVYFHATLSLAGQLIDEFAILWLLNACFGLWASAWALPGLCRTRRWLFQVFMGVSTVLGTLLGCIYPKINAYVLICFCLPIVVILIGNMNRSHNDVALSLSKRCLITWGIAVTIWISDRLQCPFWLSMGFPYLHSLWHILAFLSCYQASVVFAFFHTEAEYPELQPVVTYWPGDVMLLLPWLDIRSSLPLHPSKRSCKLCSIN